MPKPDIKTLLENLETADFMVKLIGDNFELFESSSSSESDYGSLGRLVKIVYKTAPSHQDKEMDLQQLKLLADVVRAAYVLGYHRHKKEVDLVCEGLFPKEVIKQ